MRLTALLTALLICASSSLPALADLSPGVAAYERKDFAAALPLLKVEAAQGDAIAQTKLGLIYAKGLNVPRDPTIALPWFKKAAAQGHAEAEYCIGVAHDIGDGIKQDRRAAADWYRKAAKQGYLKAQINLANLLDQGDGVAKDPVEAATWYRKAAEQGDVPSQNYLAHLYLKGIGVEQNLLSAKMWIDRAAAAGDPTATEAARYLASEFTELEKQGTVPRLAGGDGSSLADAIIFPDIKTESTGVSAEYKVIGFFLAGWRKVAQSLLDSDQRIYDEIELEKDGVKRSVYFDISNWFGQRE